MDLITLSENLALLLKLQIVFLQKIEQGDISVSQFEKFVDLDPASREELFGKTNLSEFESKKDAFLNTNINDFSDITMQLHSNLLEAKVIFFKDIQDMGISNLKNYHSFREGNLKEIISLFSKYGIFLKE